MKKTLIATSILVITCASAMADRQPRRGSNNRLDCRTRVQNLNQRLQSLSFENSNLSSANQTLSDNLFQCQQSRTSRNDSAKVARLKRKLQAKNVEIDEANTKIARMENKIFNKNQKIADLKVKIVELEDMLNPPTPYFNLADSIRACGGIGQSNYAKQCTSFAKQYEIQANVIEACSKISQDFYATQCVHFAGINNGYAAQVEACSEIKDSNYALTCVKEATKSNVSPDVISSCVASSNQDFYQAQCVKDMAN
jgi:hypothetical protein